MKALLYLEISKICVFFTFKREMFKTALETKEFLTNLINDRINFYNIKDVGNLIKNQKYEQQQNQMIEELEMNKDKIAQLAQPGSKNEKLKVELSIHISKEL